MRAGHFTIICIVLLLALAACGAQEPPEQAVTPVEVTRLAQVTSEVTRQVPVTVEVTRVVEVPVTVTFTPGPSPTPTITPTPTPTLTPTPTVTPSPTATPFSVAGCVNLRSVANFWNIDREDYAERLYPTYDALAGKCVKFYGNKSIGVIATDYGWLSYTSLHFIFLFDEKSPEGVTAVRDYSTVWGIWESLGEGRYRILVRRVEPFANLQQPIREDGFYMVGEDYDVAPGRWKSLWPPGVIDNCYWARTNPDTGRIKDNHFGQAGLYTRLYAGDLFESDDCAPWVYVP